MGRPWKHYCPCCKRFSGFTHNAGDEVRCSRVWHRNDKMEWVWDYRRRDPCCKEWRVVRGEEDLVPSATDVPMPVGKQAVEALGTLTVKRIRLGWLDTPWDVTDVLDYLKLELRGGDHVLVWNSPPEEAEMLQLVVSNPKPYVRVHRGMLESVERATKVVLWPDGGVDMCDAGDWHDPVVPYGIKVRNIDETCEKLEKEMRLRGLV